MSIRVFGVVVDGIIICRLSALVHMLLSCARLCGRGLVLIRLRGSGGFFMVVIVIVNDYDFFGRLAAKELVPIDWLVPRSLDSSAI